MNRKDRKSQKELQESLEVLLQQYPSGSRFAESYRTLRTNLFFSAMEKDLKAVIVTSSVEKEGKTTSAINLGYTIAQADKKVLLIDADLRKPKMSRLLSARQKMGLSGLISEKLGARPVSGRLSDFSTGDLIQLTRLQQRTCELNLKDEQHNVSLFFIKGELKDIYWKDRPDSKKLANSLMAKKLLTREEATLALGHQKKSIQRLGTILFNMGLVSKQELVKALSVHTIEAIRAAASVKDGFFSFSPYSEERGFSSVSQDADLEKIVSEFISTGEENGYIHRSITETIYSTEMPNLYLLPSGGVPANPTDLVSSQRAKYIINFLKSRFDFIIIDTPPVMPASDALVISQEVDGTILVIRSGHTEKKVVKDVAQRFEMVNCPILGVLLNRVDFRKEGYYRYYNKYYSSYYGGN